MDNKKVYSYSLKKKKLKKWIYENNYTLPYVAKRLGISICELIIQEEMIIRHIIQEELKN